MKKRLPIIILIIAALYAADYFGTQQTPASDTVNALAPAANEQQITRSAPTATKRPAATATPNPQSYTYVLNKSSKKFHYPSCYSVTQMKDSNKIYSSESRQEIINKGYTPCGNCHP